MHITPDARRDRNVLAAWALAVADAVRIASEESTGLSGGAPAALVAIVADPGLSIDQLRHVLALTHPGTVRLVDRLVDKAGCAVCTVWAAPSIPSRRRPVAGPNDASPR